MADAHCVDVLFVYTNVNGFHVDTYSFGIGYLSSVLKSNGFSAKLEVVNTIKDYRNVIRAVLRYRPKVVAFTAVSSQFVFVCDLAKAIRKVYGGLIVCGGVHPTIFPDCLYSAMYFDGIFIGESEFSFADFVSAVVNKGSYKDTDNFCYIYNGKLVRNKLRPRVKNLEELPFPDREIYRYQSIIDECDGTATVMTSRGCPFLCSYCANHAIARVYNEDRNLIRYNSVDRSIEEISRLKSWYKFSRLYFIDDLFILNNLWLDEFLSKYKQRFDIPFMCHIRPDVCTRDTLFKLKGAGCYSILLSVESANDHIRNVVMRRNITKEQLTNAFNWAREAGIDTLSVSIIGVPGDTENTILETIDFNKKMNPAVIGLNIYSPYEGTELGDYCREKGFLRAVDSRRFFDRAQSRLVLPTISNSALMKLYNNFHYLVYKDSAPLKLKNIIWGRRYKLLEDNILFGFLFRKFRKMKATRIIGRKIKQALAKVGG